MSVGEDYLEALMLLLISEKGGRHVLDVFTALTKHDDARFDAALFISFMSLGYFSQ